MALAIRLARGGAKKRPYYRIVVADSRQPRDGRFIEKIGTYNPMLAKDDENRVKIDVERAQHWMKNGARPSDRVSRFLEGLEALPVKTRNNPNKAKPGQKALDREEERREKEAARTEAEAAAKAEASTADAGDETPAEAEAPADAAEAEATES